MNTKATYLNNKGVEAEMMNVEEVTRMIDGLKVFGLTDEQINKVVKYIATGVNFPEKEAAEAAKKTT